MKNHNKEGKVYLSFIQDFQDLGLVGRGIVADKNCDIMSVLRYKDVSKLMVHDSYEEMMAQVEHRNRGLWACGFIWRPEPLIIEVEEPNFFCEWVCGQSADVDPEDYRVKDHGIPEDLIDDFIDKIMEYKDDYSDTTCTNHKKE